MIVDDFLIDGIENQQQSSTVNSDQQPSVLCPGKWNCDKYDKDSSTMINNAQHSANQPMFDKKSKNM